MCSKVSETDIGQSVPAAQYRILLYIFTHFVWLSGPDMTAKLCLAPNNTLLGVAVSGGENKVSLIPLPVVCVATVLLLCF